MSPDAPHRHAMRLLAESAEKPSLWVFIIETWYYLELFGAGSIQWLLAEREFIGGRWMDFLNENKIPFAIRVKESLTIVLEDNKAWTLRSLLRRCRARCVVRVIEGRLPETATPVRVAVRHLKSGEWLIVMTNAENAKAALSAYRKRWAIECLFGDAKTRGLNLEDTRITDPAKLATLMAIIALAMTWAYRSATQIKGRRSIRRKAHGRYEKSWFRTGLDALRTALVADHEFAIIAWTTPTQRRRRNR